MQPRELIVQLRTRRTEDTNFHHILYQSGHYNTGYAKRLREHPYMGGYLLKELHEILHGLIRDISTPNEAACKRAFEELVRREKAGLIDIWSDSLPQRIDFLLEVWHDTCPLAIITTLEWQRDIIVSFNEPISTPPPKKRD